MYKRKRDLGREIRKLGVASIVGKEKPWERERERERMMKGMRDQE